MGLLQNGFRDTIGVFRTYGATVSNNAYPYIARGNYDRTGMKRNLTAGEGITDDKVGVPMGYTDKGWIMPQKAGMISARTEGIGIDTSASGLRGLVAEGSTTFGINTNTPDGQLVSTVQAGAAPATFGISTNTPELTASLSGVGSATIGITAEDALLGALGGMVATSTFGLDGTLTSYAVGHMEGSTADAGVTVDNIVTALESAVLPVNIVKVNSYTVEGAGTSGNPWGPV
jgi:hypothetical protein